MEVEAGHDSRAVTRGPTEPDVRLVRRGIMPVGDDALAHTRAETMPGAILMERPSQ
jgi:hypothetical protein